MRFLVLVWLLVTSSRLAHAQQPVTAQAAFDYLQDQRARVRAVVGKADNPPADSLRKGQRILNEALVYYARPDVQALAKTNRPLHFRRSDILFDLARLQSQLGQPAEVVSSLRQIMGPEFEGLYAEWIIEEPLFATARQDSALKIVLDKAAATSAIFNSKALATPYQPNLSDAEKVAGLSKLWSEAKYNFAYFDHIPNVDWDKLYLQYIPKIQSTTSTLAYYRVLKQFCAQLHDGHTNVWAVGQPLLDSVNAGPPITGELIDGRVWVQQVRHDSLRQTGIIPGLEIVRIDGIPTVTYAERYVRPYQSGSTTQNVDVQTYSYQLLKGARNRPVTIEFRDNKGKTFTRKLPRDGYGRMTPFEAVNLRFLPGNIAYLQVNEFESDKGYRRFAAAFDSIATTNALIIDLRRNGGGNSNNGFSILNYLTDKPYSTGSYQSRIYSPVGRARGDKVRFEPVDTGSVALPAGVGKLYTKPVVVLIGGMTFSAAEDFCSAYVGMKRGALIGEPTGGSTGQPLVFTLPGGVMARVCTKRDGYPDGTEWNGRGIEPTVLVRPTVADVQTGQDTVLKAALKYLETTYKPITKK